EMPAAELRVEQLQAACGREAVRQIYMPVPDEARDRLHEVHVDRIAARMPSGGGPPDPPDGSAAFHEHSIMFRPLAPPPEEAPSPLI
ncbi:hypothetical protein ACFQ07_06885, partial [Actinomadura adrarensis]